MTVKLLHSLIVQSGVIGLIIGFTQMVLVKYVTNTHAFKQGILKSKKISNDQELIQSDPTSRPQNQKGNN